MKRPVLLLVALFVTATAISFDDKRNADHSHSEEEADRKKHHHHRHAHKGSKKVPPVTANGAPASAAPDTLALATQSQQEASDASATRPVSVNLNGAASGSVEGQGKILVFGPLPADFEKRFVTAVAEATGVAPDQVKVIEARQTNTANVMEVTFEAPHGTIETVEQEAAQPESKLGNGPLHSFLVESSGERQERLSQKKLQINLDKKKEASTKAEGVILVNGPLPADFSERFVQAVYQSTSADPNCIKILDMTPVTEANSNVVEVSFEAPRSVVEKVENEAADPNSKLARGNLREFLVAEDEKEEPIAPSIERDPAQQQVQSLPVEERGVDYDTMMPYGELEPFGREDTAQELTESSVRESDEMVDQLERAEVAEEKRAVFRALTRLRGAAITSFDGVARSQTGNIDAYNKIHKWRASHPVHHLADEESDISKWAFPDNADF